MGFVSSIQSFTCELVGGKIKAIGKSKVKTMAHETGGILGQILVYFAKGNIAVYILVVAAIAYFLSKFASDWYADGIDKDPEIKKMSDKERRKSVRNINFLIFILLFAIAILTRWVSK